MMLRSSGGLASVCMFLGVVGLAGAAGASAAPFDVPDVEWQLIAPGSAAPDRAFHGMVYDPVNETFWSFGGVTADPASNQFRNTVDRLDATDPNAKWSHVSIGGLRPPPLAFHTLTYDPVRHQLIAYGGLVDRRGSSDQEPADGNAIWVLELSDPANIQWVRRTALGNPTDRFAHAAVYVPGIDALVVVGGAETFQRSTASSYALMLSQNRLRWVRLPNYGFSARAGHALVYDEVNTRLLAYGGVDDLTDLNSTREIVELDLSKGLSGAQAWTRVTTATPGLSRGFMATAFDPGSRLWWVHGGLESANSFVRDLSVLDLSKGKPEWIRTQEVVNGPLERFGHTAALDEARDRIVFQGGTPDNAVTQSDTRELRIAPAPTPTASATATTGPITPTATLETTPTPTVGASETASPTATNTPEAPSSPTPTATLHADSFYIWLPLALKAGEL